MNLSLFEAIIAGLHKTDPETESLFNDIKYYVHMRCNESEHVELVGEAKRDCLKLLTEEELECIIKNYLH